MAGEPRASAIVVARDEEAFIRPCLEHLQWCDDERILVDMQSADRPRLRPADLVTAILDQPLIPHMEFARNHGIDAATGDWILIVDANELVPPRLAELLRAQIASDPAAAGIWLPRMNHCFGRPLPHIGDFPDYQLRCFRRGAGRYPDRLHSAPAIDGRTVFLPIQEGAWLVHGRAGLTIGDLVRMWNVYAEKRRALTCAPGDGSAGRRRCSGRRSRRSASGSSR
ncbi:MAG: glycosyltransferase [Candidatus Rokuibacteriota bacterium]